METSTIYNPSDTICAISTPPGTGAIAIIRLSGSEAIAIADKIWQGKPLSSAKSHTAHLGYIGKADADTPLDQAVATVFRAPASFTGDDVVEFAVHGSRWVQRQLISLLIKSGARMALPGEFTQRAFAAGKMDLAEAEAVADMIAASSEAAHRLAISQMRGDFSKHIEKLRSELVDLASLLELELDFSEEDVEFASRERLHTLAAELHAELSRLAKSFDAGAAIKDGIPVAIIGPTNAGKSSLLNALLGDERAIVSDIHGTTRDIVEDAIELPPYLIRFKDTAGLRKTSDTIENIGIERSRQAARTAGLIIFVIDPTNAQPETIHAELSGIDSERIIFAINKSDIAPLDCNIEDMLSKTYPSAPIVHISAKYRKGIDTLKQSIKDICTKITDNAGDADMIVTNARHAHALSAAAASAKAVEEGLNTQLPPDLIAQDLRETIHHLASVTGQITTSEILQTIFSRFCIGK